MTSYTNQARWCAGGGARACNPPGECARGSWGAAAHTVACRWGGACVSVAPLAPPLPPAVQLSAYVPSGTFLVYETVANVILGSVNVTQNVCWKGNNTTVWTAASMLVVVWSVLCFSTCFLLAFTDTVASSVGGNVQTQAVLVLPWHPHFLCK